MKKCFVSIVAMMMSAMSFANSAVVCKMVHAEDSLSTENQVKRTFNLVEPSADIIMKIGEHAICFTVYDVKEVGNKTYLYGKSNYGINVMSLDKKEIRLALPGTRQLIIEDKDVAEKIISSVRL